MERLILKQAKPSLVMEIVQPSEEEAEAREQAYWADTPEVGDRGIARPVVEGQEITSLPKQKDVFTKTARVEANA